MRAPRSARLPKLKPKTRKIEPANSRYERGTSRGQVKVHEENWWDKVPDRIRKRTKTRMEEDAKFKWHGTRGGSEIEYCDFGDLSSIIVVNWSDFELTLSDMEWAKSLLGVLERSRNIVMHGGVLAIQDIERIGGNIRDWVRQTG